jgi:FMN phosphatase YigB (HAD superfamily)
VGARKPSFIYYQSFLQMYPQFKECIYLDDNTENLNSSLKNGLSGRYFNLQDYKDDDILNALQGFKSIIC